MEPVDERDLILARRLKVGVRLVIYPLLVGLLVLAWQHRQSAGAAAADGPPPDLWQGRSSQGLSIEMTSYGSQLEDMDIPLKLSCSDGIERPFEWTPSRDIYRQQGDRVSAHRPATTHPNGDGWKYTYEGWLSLAFGARPSATVRLLNTYKNGEHVVACTSGDVRVSFTRR